MRRRPFEILQIEDNPGDIRLTAEAFREGRVPHHFIYACDGVEAISLLRREGHHATAPRPDLILLDLNLPRMSGWEVLDVIKFDPNLKRIPVVVLTSSDDEGDILRAYNSHANSYIVKPADLVQFVAMVHIIMQFWFTTVTLPPR